MKNYRALTAYLEHAGVELETETDTEVLAKLIGHFYEGDLTTAVLKALSEVRGTFGIAVLHADQPDMIVGARRGQPP